LVLLTSQMVGNTLSSTWEEVTLGETCKVQNWYGFERIQRMG